MGDRNLELALKIKALVEGSKNIEALADEVRDLVNQARRDKVPDITEDMRRGADETVFSVGKLNGALKALAGAAVVQQFIQVNASMESLEKSLAAVTGSAQAAAGEMDFIRAEADRLGVEVGAAAQSFLTLAAATKGTNLEGQATREIWSAVAGKMAELGASSADVQGAMIQLAQGASKGRFELEDLKSITERIPGFFDHAAKALGVTTAEFFKMVSAGQVTADFLPSLARQLSQGAGDIDTFNANLARLKNSLTDIATSIGSTGVFDALSSAIKFAAESIKELATVMTGVLAVSFGRAIASLKDSASAHLAAAAAAKIQAAEEAKLAATSAQAAVVKAQADKQAAIAAQTRAMATLQEAVAERKLMAEMAVYGPARARVEATITQAHIARKAAADAAAVAETRLAAATAASNAATAGMAKAGLAARALSGVLGFLGGPIGAITTLLTLGASAWLIWGAKSDKASEKAGSSARKAGADIAAGMAQATPAMASAEEQAQQLAASFKLLAIDPEEIRTGMNAASRAALDAFRRIAADPTLGGDALLGGFLTALDQASGEAIPALAFELKSLARSRPFEETRIDADRLAAGLEAVKAKTAGLWPELAKSNTKASDLVRTYQQLVAEAGRLRAGVKQPVDESIEGQASATFDLANAQEKLLRLQGTGANLDDIRAQADLVRTLSERLTDQNRAQEAVNQAALLEAAALEREATAIKRVADEAGKGAEFKVKTDFTEAREQIAAFVAEIGRQGIQIPVSLVGADGGSLQTALSREALRTGAR